MPKTLKKIVKNLFDFKALDRNLPLLFLCLLVVIIRVPFLFEPHYYLDEGIYLTIGQGVNKGLSLYRDVFDHKTPLIYLLATLCQTFFTWRVTGFFLALATATLFFAVSRRLLKNRVLAFVAALLFVLATNLPMFEGNVLNGELLAMFFSLGAIFLAISLPQRWWEKFFSRVPEKPFLFFAGALSGLAFLTKFHAIFDFIPLLFFVALPWQKKHTVKKLLWVVGGFIAVNLLAVLYFFLRGNLSYYIYSAFIYNFAYSGAAGDHSVIIKVVIFGLVAALFLSHARLKRRQMLNKTTIFIGMWLLATLFAANLSGRAYPHYFLQVFPPLCLLITIFFDQLLGLNFKHGLKKILRDNPGLWRILVVLLFSLYIYQSMNIDKVKVVSYYQNFWQYARGQKNYADYIKLFGAVTRDNYKIGYFLTQSGEHELLVFGNNPTLYSLVDMKPILPFTTNFHYYDFASENGLKVYDDLAPHEMPKLVVVMKQLDGGDLEQKDFALLQQFLNSDYLPIYDGETLVLWQRK